MNTMEVGLDAADFERPFIRPECVKCMFHSADFTSISVHWCFPSSRYPSQSQFDWFSVLSLSAIWYINIFLSVFGLNFFLLFCLLIFFVQNAQYFVSYRYIIVIYQLFFFPLNVMNIIFSGLVFFSYHSIS